MSQPFTIERFQELKARVDGLRAERDQAVGALKELKKRLAKDFGCATVAEAKTKLKKLDEQIALLERKFSKAMQNLEEQDGNK
jgi:hypothetical protein